MHPYRAPFVPRRTPGFRVTRWMRFCVRLRQRIARALGRQLDLRHDEDPFRPREMWE